MGYQFDKGERRKLAGDPAWAALRAGLMINQLRWDLTQELLVGDVSTFANISRAIRRLVPAIRVIATSDLSLRLKASLTALSQDWRATKPTEWLAESVSKTHSRYWRMAKGEEVEDDFNDAVKYALDFELRARSLVTEAMGDREDLKTCFLLGETIDQGIRPTITGTAVFRQVLNPEYFLRRRSSGYREAVERHRVDMALYREAMTRYRLEWTKLREGMGPVPRVEEDEVADDDDDDHERDRAVDRLLEGQRPSRPARPKLPRKHALVARRLSEGDLPLEPGWHEEVEALWNKLPMPVELPAAFFAIGNKIEKLARVGLVRALVRTAEEACIRLAGVRMEDEEPDSTPPEWSDAEGTPPGVSKRLIEGQGAVIQARGDETVSGADSIPTFAIINRSAFLASEKTIKYPIPSPEEFSRLRAIKKEIDPEGTYIGNSLPILRVFEEINRLDRTPDASILIYGPSGAGKGQLPELIHRHSSRRRGEFREVHASDMHGSDFQMIKASWAGLGKHSGVHGVPKEGTSGLLQICRGGTIFVDEVADLPKPAQEFLRHVLDGKPIPLTGEGATSILPNVRLILATYQDLALAVDEKRFILDLHRRISHRTIVVPPLAERKEDILSFVRSMRGDHVPDFRFLGALLRHSWPGNVGELQDVLAGALARTSRETDKLTVKQLETRKPLLAQAVREVQELGDDEAEGDVYRRVVQLLELQGFRRGQGLQEFMVELLGVSRSTISRRLKEYLSRPASNQLPAEDSE